MDDRELLIRYRDGELAGEEKDRLEARLRSEVDLRGRLERLDDLSEELRRSATTSFAPFFASRVMARVRDAESGGPVEALYESLRWMFARVAVVGLVVMLGLGAYSALGGGYGGSVVDAVLGLPEATLQTALTLGG